MSGYIGSTPVPQATQHRESFTATEGQTSFATAGYTPQFVDVYLNGSHLSPADFTATNGSDVVLGVAASADDVCDIVSYTPFEVAGATFTGTTTLDGAVVINESSADVDFRVESDNQTHALFVQGSDGFVGIGVNTPGAPLHIEAADNANLLRFTVTGQEDWAFKGASVSKPTTGNDTISFGIVGGNQAMTWDELGICTKPLQPAFLVRPASAQNNIAADNSAVTVVFGTETFDQNGNFASNTFTAPVTGKYQLDANVYLINLDSASGYYDLKLITSNGNRGECIISTNRFSGDLSYHTLQLSVLADMDADDTVIASLRQNSGTAQTDVGGASYFSGYLVA